MCILCVLIGVYTCVQEHIHVCAGAHACVCTCIWRLEVSSDMPGFSGSIHF